MKKTGLISIILFICCIQVFSQECPDLYFKFGTTRDDVLFELGEPKIYITYGNLLYENYTGSTLEAIVFVFDEDKKMIGVNIDIIPQYNVPIPEKELMNKIYKTYLDKYTDFYGPPTLQRKDGIYWKFDNAFVAYMPYMKEGGLRFYFTVMLKEYAAARKFDFIFNEQDK